MFSECLLPRHAVLTLCGQTIEMKKIVNSLQSRQNQTKVDKTQGRSLVCVGKTNSGHHHEIFGKWGRSGLPVGRRRRFSGFRRMKCLYGFASCT
jgi:hypothetical protein